MKIILYLHNQLYFFLHLIWMYLTIGIKKQKKNLTIYLVSNAFGRENEKSSNFVLVNTKIYEKHTISNRR